MVACRASIAITRRLATGRCASAVYQPPQASRQPCPVLYFLAGLTCTEETATIKAGAQRLAAELGLILVMPDTSPRDTGFEGATGDWEFGEGAGFYVDATEAPWSSRFRMHSLCGRRAASPDRRAVSGGCLDAASICGHSMGGHGALTIALKHPQRYRSVSAFAPIVAPSQVPWGQKALPRFLGDDPCGLGGLRCLRAGAQADLCRHDPDRSGRGGSVPRRAAEAGAVRPGLRRGGSAVAAAPARRVTTTATGSSPASSTTTCAITPQALGLA